ncbi:MAG: response regulator [Pseudomonadota bacterium]
MAVCLVVDSSEAVRTISNRLLSALGVKTIECTTAEEGFDALTDKKPDVVLLDWDLPSVSAVKFLTDYAALDAKARVPIVLLITENDPQQMAIAKTAGVTEFMFKPFDADQLKEALLGLGVLPKSSKANAGQSKRGPGRPRKGEPKVQNAS